MQWLTRVLMIREEERAQLLFFVALFVLLGLGLALGRGSMSALFLKRYGIQYLPVMYAVLSVCMTAASFLYAAYVDRFPAERMLVRMFAALGVTLVLIWGTMSSTGAEWVYPAYFLAYELAAELLVVHSRLYMEQNFNALQLQRLTSPILASVMIGKIFGGLLLGLLAPLINIANILPLWMFLVVIPALFIVRHHRREGFSPYFRPVRKGRGGWRQPLGQIAQGFRFLRTSQLLQASLLALFFMLIAFFILDYSVDRVLTETFHGEQQLASFIGWITAVTGTTALLVQLFVSGKLLRRFGTTRIGLVAPASLAISFVAFLVTFTLPAALVGMFARDVVMQAIRRPARMALLRALPGYMMGRVNAMAVGLVLPVALLVASSLLLLTQALPVPTYFVVGGLLASLAYLFFRHLANRAYAPTLLATLSHRLFLPDRHGNDFQNAGNEELVKELVRGIASPDENMVHAYARMLVVVRPEDAPRAIAERLPTLSPPARDRLLRLLIAQRLPVMDILHALLADPDPHLRATILVALFEARDARTLAQVVPCLASDNPRLAAAGVFGVHCYALHEHEAQARQTWERLLASVREEDNLAGLELLGRLHDRGHLSRLGELLEHRTDRVRGEALEALARFPAGSLAEFTDRLRAPFQSDDPAIRTLCVAASRVLDPEAGRTFCVQAIGDEHHAVREAALTLLEEREGRDHAVEIVAGRILENRGTPRTQQSILAFLARHRLPNDVFERIANLKVREAGALFHAREVLQHDLDKTANDEKMELLNLVLRERVMQTIDLALMAMENFEDRTTISAIRAGLASGDSRQMARACEALQSLHHQALGKPLIAIIDPAGSASRERRATTSEVFRTAKDVVAWCARHPDAWLSECAGRAGSSPVPVGA